MKTNIYVTQSSIKKYTTPERRSCLIYNLLNNGTRRISESRIGLPEPAFIYIK